MTKTVEQQALEFVKKDLNKLVKTYLEHINSKTRGPLLPLIDIANDLISAKDKLDEHIFNNKTKI